eukprot:3816028-Rhodomonas_salina.2
MLHDVTVSLPGNLHGLLTWLRVPGWDKKLTGNLYDLDEEGNLIRPKKSDLRAGAFGGESERRRRRKDAADEDEDEDEDEGGVVERRERKRDGKRERAEKSVVEGGERREEMGDAEVEAEVEGILEALEEGELMGDKARTPLAVDDSGSAISCTHDLGALLSALSMPRTLLSAYDSISALCLCDVNSAICLKLERSICR